MTLIFLETTKCIEKGGKLSFIDDQLCCVVVQYLFSAISGFFIAKGTLNLIAISLTLTQHCPVDTSMFKLLWKRLSL